MLALQGFWEIAGFVINVWLFLLVGMQLSADMLLREAWPIALAVVALHVGRAVAVYGIFGALRLAGEGVSWRWQHVMVFGNIKGALSMAAVLALPADIPYRERLVTIVFGVTFITLVTQALPFRPGLGVRLETHRAEPRLPFLEQHSRGQQAHLVHAQRRPDAHGVLPLDTVAGMGHALRPFAVVGEQDEPLRVTVEATDGVEAPGAAGERSGHQVDDGALGVPVGHGRGDTRRLVERQMDRTRPLAHGPTVHRDDIDADPDPLTQRRSLAVDRDPPRFHQHLRGAARCHGRVGECLLDAHGLHGHGEWSVTAASRPRAPWSWSSSPSASASGTIRRAATSASSGGSSSRDARPNRSRNSKLVA